MDAEKFVISLDFELMWGCRDTQTIESYGDAIIGARTALEQILFSFEKHDIKATISQFENDLKLAIIVAEKNDITLKSIVFPKNQYNADYIEVCRKYGITSFRGSEKSRIYESTNSGEE